MAGFSLKHLLIGLAMLATAGLAVALAPHERIAARGPRINLETMIPKQFGQWKLDETIAPIIPNPEQQAIIDKIYNQTLSRTYINSQGERIMLAIAYGGDQSKGMEVHRPEVCYPAQGFQILSANQGTLNTPNGVIPVKHLVAEQGPRIEPITYWITLGDEVPAGGIRLKLTQLKYGLTGKIPDGLLFRVSSIEADDKAAYAAQSAFINDLLNALPARDRVRLAGIVRH
jgi:EpsI family protein